jgi:hypothetical protein
MVDVEYFMIVGAIVSAAIGTVRVGIEAWRRRAVGSLRASTVREESDAASEAARADAA